MPANVETAAFANTPAWHREGVVLDTDGKKGMTIEQALPASGLDWTVEKNPHYVVTNWTTDRDGNKIPAADPRLVLMPGKYDVQRDTDQRAFGVVGRSWTPMQNVEGFQLVNDLVEQDEVFIEAAGALDGGRQVWVLAHCPEDLFIAGETISQYILFTNGHDGRTAVTAAITPVRVVCQNTLSWAINLAKGPRGENGGGRILRVRHTTNASKRIQEAKHLLGLRSRYAEELAKQGEWLVEKTMSDGQFEKFLARLMPIKDEKEDSPARTMIVKRRDEVKSLYMTASNLTPIRGTRWGALQAVVEYADYGVERRDVSTMMKAQTGIASNAPTIKDRALELLTA